MGIKFGVVGGGRYKKILQPYRGVVVKAFDSKLIMRKVIGNISLSFGHPHCKLGVGLLAGNIVQAVVFYYRLHDPLNILAFKLV